MESRSVTTPVDFAPLREAYFRHTQAELKAGGFHLEHPPHSAGDLQGAGDLQSASTAHNFGAAGHAHVNLHDIWHAAREMLTHWGFDLALVDRLPIGFFGSAETLGHRLLQDGHSADDIRASNLLADTRLPGRLVGPIRDRSGHIVSFWARTIGAGGGRTLYLSGRWKALTAVIGLDAAVQSPDGGHDLLLVEDLLDALLLQSRGMPSVVAVGSAASDMTSERWKRLAELGVQRVTLLLESFRTPEPSATAAIDHAAQATSSPAVYVLLGAQDDDAAAVRETLLARESPTALRQSPDMNGYEATSQLLGRCRLHGFHYRALQIIAAHRPETFNSPGHDWTDSSRRAVLREAQAFYTAAHPRNIPALDTFFLPPLLDALGIGWAVPKGRWEDRIGGNGVAPSMPPEPVAARADLWESEPPLRNRTVWVRSTTGYCAKHGCQRNECLCWD